MYKQIYWENTLGRTFSFLMFGVALINAVCAALVLPALQEGTSIAVLEVTAYFLVADFLGRRTAWMLGRTPPWAMVTPARSLFNSSSLRMAS